MKDKVYYKLCFLLVLLLLFGKAFSQNTVIDSLKTRLNEVEGEDKIKVLIGLSYNYLRISVDTSLIYSNEAYNYSKKINNQRGVARAFLMTGNGYSFSGDYTKALEFHNQALKIFKELHDTAAVGITYNNLGIDYQNIGQYSKAIEQYQSSYRIAEELSNKIGLYYALNNIGIIYEDWGKFNMALEHYQNALKIAEELDNKSYIGISLQNIGVAYHKLGNFDKALEYLAKSLEVSNQIGDKKGIFNTLINTGDILVKLNDNQKAIDNFNQALQTSDESGNKTNIALASLKLGEVYTLEKKYDKSEPLLKEALKLAKEIEETKLIKDAYKALSDYYFKVNDYKNAYANYTEYTILKDTLYNRESRHEITEMQTLYELDKKEKEIEIQDLKIEKQQNRFYYIIFAVVLLIILALLLFNSYKLKQKHYRTDLERKNIDIEQRLLRTQMNPHFIFNSLNSINSFITDNNSDSAQSFLSKFARLMRYILENSRKTYVPVEDEINTLELNMQLEQLRFDNKFDFEINVDEKIDQEYTFIPPMLIQPFIENAIIHGIAGMTGRGRIKVEIKPEGKLMQCTIEDNGIGRKKAMEIKRKSDSKKHRSLGMKVTQERLDILNEKNKGEVSVKIIDLKDESGNPRGTKVELRIPFENE